MRSNPVNEDTEEAIESVGINGVFLKRVEFRENVRTFFPRGQAKLSVIWRCPCKTGVRKAEFDSTMFSGQASWVFLRMRS